ncbi:MAG: urease accessory protein UreF [Methylobacteriaceae bacterium]|nr:urease accessory protein UreF [Methylobacteriaceae bacterium]
MGTLTPVAGTGMAPDPVVPLLAWLSPGFPVGAYAYSHGLEWAVEAGDVRDEDSLATWLESLLVEGFGRSDAILCAASYRATLAADWTAIGEVNDLALALAPAAELRLETSQQGRSFLDAVAATWPHPALSEAAGRLDEVAYPVALGLAAGSHRLPLGVTLRAYLTALAQALVSAAIRLAPIGQTAGQRVVAGLVPALGRVAAEAEIAGLDEVGGATLRADLGAMLHETQYTRLFRS